MKVRYDIMSVSNQTEKKELKTLTKDFGLWDYPEVQDIIENSKSYEKSLQAIMKVYDRVYLQR